MTSHLDLDTLVLAPGKHDTPADGLCECRCGNRAPLAARTNRRLGHVKGQPLRFLVGHNRRMTQPLAQVRPQDTGCWEWLGSHDRKGYARVQRARVHTGAHRVIYELLIGPIPEGMQLDHLCRNRGCVNPTHLEPVSNAENVRRSTVTRLAPPEVARIRDAVGTHEAIARQFGVSRQTVSDIRRGARWAVQS